MCWQDPIISAAIALLTGGIRVRPWQSGLYWGIGHTLGLLTAGLAALMMRGLVPVDWLSSMGERLGGVALVLVGLWGLRRGFSHKLHAHEHVHEGVRHTRIHSHEPHMRHQAGGSHRHTHGLIAIGVLHGVAGGAGIFAVPPAPALPARGESVSNLAAFLAGSLAAMTLYSWVLANALVRLRRFSLRPYRTLLSGTSATAIVLGWVWLLN